MGGSKPTYEELERRLAEADRALAACRSQEADAIAGKTDVAPLPLVLTFVDQRNGV